MSAIVYVVLSFVTDGVVLFEEGEIETRNMLTDVRLEGVFESWQEAEAHCFLTGMDERTTRILTCRVNEPCDYAL